MSKLIHASSVQTFQRAYTDWATKTSDVYKAIAYTDDGYIITHGLLMKTSITTDPGNPFGLDFTLSGQTATVTIENVSKSITLPVIGVLGGELLNVTSSNGVFTLNHDLSQAGWTGNQTFGAAADSTTSILVPQYTFDKYGHIKSSVNRSATLNNVRQTLNTDGNTKYLLFGTSSTTVDSATQFNTAIKAVASTGALYATGFVEDNEKLIDKYAIKNHASTAATYGSANGALYGHVRLLDSINNTVDVNGGYAATPKAVKTALDAANAYTDSLLAANDAMVFKGTIGTGGTVTALPFLGYSAGWTYRVITAATFAGIVCEPGDLIIAIKDGPATGTSVINADWTVAQTNIDGAVIAPSVLQANQLVVGSADRSIKALAAGTAGHVLKMVSGIPTWAEHYTSRAVNVNGVEMLAINTKTDLNLVAGKNITLTPNAGSVTITNNALDAADMNNLHFFNGSAADANRKGIYSPTGASQVTSIVSNSGIVTALSGGSIVLSHANSIASLTSQKLGSITYDANGHITGFTEVTSLRNPNSLTFGSGSSTDSYDGQVAKTFKLAGSGATSVSFANSVFTISSQDTHWTTTLKSGAASANSHSATSNGSSYIKLFDSGTLRDQFKVFGSGATSVSTDASGNINIYSLNSWRNVSAFRLSNSSHNEVLSQTIGSADLDFGDEFIWDDTAAGNGGRLHIGWAEVDANGVITYTK